MLGVSGNPARRFPFDEVLPEATFVSPCNAYRGMQPGETALDYVDRLGAELVSTIETLGPENIAAFMAEPVVGSTAGAVPFVPGYLRRMQEVCRDFGVLFIVDDVMCGMGRSGALYSHITDGFVPDMVAIGKGLAAGYQPISALLLSETVHGSIAEGSGVLRNGQTHVNHAFACSVALSVQQIVERDGLVARAADLGAQLRGALGAQIGEHPNVGDIRGMGLMIGVEFVASREHKTSLANPDEISAQFKSEGLKRDMLLYPGSGTIDGHLGNHVMFAPAFVSTNADISEIAGRFSETVAKVLAG
jgi:adenosylmethionine-8-amino-7-oxononanoate aminotransferase